MLDRENHVVSECEGLGQAISPEEATMIAITLLERQGAGEEEERHVRNVLQQEQIPPGEFVVIDSDGIRITADEIVP